jgi:hypothetical protein
MYGYELLGQVHGPGPGYHESKQAAVKRGVAKRCERSLKSARCSRKAWSAVPQAHDEQTYGEAKDGPTAPCVNLVQDDVPVSGRKSQVVVMMGPLNRLGGRKLNDAEEQNEPVRTLLQ